MNSLENELQRVTTTIAAARTRLSAANLSNNLALVRVLEEEIAAAEARRTALRTGGSKEIGSASETAAVDTEPVEAVGMPDLPAAVEEAQLSEVDDAEPQIANEGVPAVSDDMFPIDAIERANRQLDARRAEMLARHAEELRALDADQSEIDAMAQAMNAFMRKYNLAPAEGSIVRLDDERDVRQVSHG